MTRWRFTRATCPCGPARHRPGARKVADPRLVRLDRLVPRDHCAVCKLPAEARLAPLVVEAATYWDAQQVARDAFHTTSLAAEETSEEPEAVVTWSGNSFNNRSGAPGRERSVTWRE